MVLALLQRQLVPIVATGATIVAWKFRDQCKAALMQQVKKLDLAFEIGMSVKVNNYQVRQEFRISGKSETSKG